MPIQTRAWMMSIRHRTDGEPLDVAEQRFKALKSGDYKREIRDVLTLQGHLDVAVIFESDQHAGLLAYQFVGFLRRQVAASVQTTITYLAADIDPRPYPTRSPQDVCAYIVGIRTTPRADDSLLTTMRQIKEVKVADGVWGDFDIMALLLRTHANDDSYRSLLTTIANLPGVARVTTLQEIR